MSMHLSSIWGRAFRVTAWMKNTNKLTLPQKWVCVAIRCAVCLTGLWNAVPCCIALDAVLSIIVLLHVKRLIGQNTRGNVINLLIRTPSLIPGNNHTIQCVAMCTAIYLIWRWNAVPRSVPRSIVLVVVTHIFVFLRVKKLRGQNTKCDEIVMKLKLSSIPNRINGKASEEEEQDFSVYLSRNICMGGYRPLVCQFSWSYHTQGNWTDYSASLKLYYR